MRLQLDVKPVAEDNGKPEQQNRLPGELRFAPALLRRHVRQNQRTSYCPLPELICREPGKPEYVPRSNHPHLQDRV